MKDSLIVEVVCYNITSVVEAEKGGANRIELCDSPGEGGTTPSFGTIQLAKERVSIPIFVMIRPRGGDFYYSDDEFEVMKRDIISAKQQGADGVVFGVLHSDGSIDKARCRELIQLAYPMKATCHRAFDMTNAPFEALEDCIEAGFHRILSSGQQTCVQNGLALLSSLEAKAAGRIIIMPGAGISEENVAEVLRKTSASEIHISGKTFLESPMTFRNPAVAMGDDPREYQKLLASSGRIRKIRELAEKALRS